MRQSRLRVGGWLVARYQRNLQQQRRLRGHASESVSTSKPPARTRPRSVPEGATSAAGRWALPWPCSGSSVLRFCGGGDDRWTIVS
eukprot:COSAG01_NODE_4039_length_5406_cov_1.715980_5_plen_86_part_00